MIMIIVKDDKVENAEGLLNLPIGYAKEDIKQGQIMNVTIGKGFTLQSKEIDFCVDLFQLIKIQSIAKIKRN